MSRLSDWVARNRKAITRYVSETYDYEVTNDRERREWVENDEYLYTLKKGDIDVQFKD
jgi:hypothetical protein